MTDIDEIERPEAPHAASVSEVVEALGTDPDRGLDSGEVEARRERFGSNTLRERDVPAWWRIAFDQFRSPLVLLLAVAAGLSLAVSEPLEAIAILAVILIDVGIGFVAEFRARRSIAALRRMAETRATVRRDGQRSEIPAEELVPGDVVLIEAGEVVGADLRLMKADKLQVDESALTGESVPVSKSTDPVDADAETSERTSMVFRGTPVTRGEGAGVVVATGEATELGKISEMVAGAEAEVSPLEERLEALSSQLLKVTLVIAALITAAGVLTGRDFIEFVTVGIALAVAAVPEGLPIVTTLALARGMWRMADRNALVERLDVIETLGSTTVILTDKTGTLTENRMTVTEIALERGRLERESEGEAFGGGEDAERDADDPPVRDAFRVMALCESSELAGDHRDEESPNGDGDRGDPMELALLRAARTAGIERAELLEEMPEAAREPFDPEVRMMATVHERADGDGYFVAVKGAPEAVFEGVTAVRTSDGDESFDAETWREHSEELTGRGLRVLALACHETASSDADPFEELVLLGLVGLEDPPRDGVAEAVADCRTAGIRVVMLTGDDPRTAASIARAVGLVEEEDPEVFTGRELRGDRDEGIALEPDRVLETSIFARVSPRQKLDLVELWQDQGEIVAMTGDGVNDAPALQKADVGVAMGQRGTDVAREASDMILRDDAFESIVAAVEAGRGIFGNIRRFVLFLLSCNVAEVLVIALATLTGLPLPLLPLQILFVNLVTDLFPAFALGFGETGEGAMRRPPRDPDEGILRGRDWRDVAVFGSFVAGATLGAFVISLLVMDHSATETTTVAFLTLMLAQLWHVFNLRDPAEGILVNQVTTNPWIWGALALSVGMVLATVYTPLSIVLEVETPDLATWGLVVGASLLPLIAGQIHRGRSGSP